MRVFVSDSEIAPSDNDWGVPSLDPEMQPSAVTAPVVAWGSVARTTRHGGTWHFYVDDRRFASERLAEQVEASRPAAVVEPNYSIFDWTPRAVALGLVYQKRRLAWQFQRRNIPIFVDVCVPSSVYDLALLGVPSGWQAYATRGFEARANELESEYRLAADHAAATPLFVVYGGGKRVSEVVARLPGVVHLRDHMTSVRHG